MISRNITDEHVEAAIRKGEIIKEYPDDKPYPSKLLYIMIDKRPIHIVVGRMEETGACIIITVYIAGEDIWEPDFRTKKSKMNCVICKTGVTEKGKTNSMFERDGNFIIVKDIPAEICNQCGEAYFDENTTREILNTVNEALNNGAELEVIRLKAA